ncbi:hypothetical protein Tco_0337637 [Tanacetum coccineum]
MKITEREVDASEDEWLKEALKKLPITSKKGEHPSRMNSGSGSDSEDNDYFVDEENLIDDVEVDMADFKSHTDADVEWVGCKETVIGENEVFELEEVDHEDFDSWSNTDESVGRKALRKVTRMHKAKVGKGQVPDFANNNMGSVVPITCDPKAPTSKVQPKSMLKKKTKPIEYYGCPWAMQVSKLPNEATWEVKTLEDNHKCLQSRIVKKCTATYYFLWSKTSIKQDPKNPISAIKINSTQNLKRVTKQKHGELITIFGAVVKPTLDELSALWLSCSWIYDALAVSYSASEICTADDDSKGLRVTSSADQVQLPVTQRPGSAAEVRCQRLSRNTSAGSAKRIRSYSAREKFSGLSFGSGLHSEMVFGSQVWKLIDTSYRALWDTTYWGFLGVRTTFDIFQNILLLYCKYGVLMSPGYSVLGLHSFVVTCEVAQIRRIFLMVRHGYAVSSLMDTAYWSSE